MTCAKCGGVDCAGQCPPFGGVDPKPLAVRPLAVLAVLALLALAWRQRARRAWRAVWWAVAGFVNWRWRCQLCQRRALRGSSLFCRKCCLAGLGFLEESEPARSELVDESVPAGSELGDP